MSAGSSSCRPSSCMNAYSRGSGAGPERNISASLPSCLKPSDIASSEPSASPSGFSWVTTRKRSRSRNAATTACRSLDVCVILWCELVDQPAHSHAVLDGRIVLEGQLWGSFHAQLAREARLQQAVSGVEAAHRRGSLLLGPEHADEHGGVTEIRRR